MRLTCSALLLSLFWLYQGCSILMVNSPPDNIPANSTPENIHCTDTYNLPISDNIVAVIGAITAIGGAFIYNDAAVDTFEHDVGFPVTLTGAALSAVFGASAYLGYQKVIACQQAKQILPPAFDSIETVETEPLADENESGAETEADIDSKKEGLETTPQTENKTETDSGSEIQEL